MAKNSIYLIAYYYLKPGRHVNTQTAGWMKENKNLIYDEKVTVSRRLNKNDETMAKVIIDLVNKKVVRNGWGNDLTFDQIFEYFHKGYPQYTTGIMTDLDPVYLEKFKETLEVNEEAENTGTISSAA